MSIFVYSTIWQVCRLGVGFTGTNKMCFHYREECHPAKVRRRIWVQRKGPQILICNHQEMMSKPKSKIWVGNWQMRGRKSWSSCEQLAVSEALRFRKHAGVGLASWKARTEKQARALWHHIRNLTFSQEYIEPLNIFSQRSHVVSRDWLKDHSSYNVKGIWN